jgi:hypothetical protein
MHKLALLSIAAGREIAGEVLKVKSSGRIVLLIIEAICVAVEELLIIAGAAEYGQQIMVELIGMLVFLLIVILIGFSELQVHIRALFDFVKGAAGRAEKHCNGGNK